jgi:lysophospholipase L1-like esterase
MLSLILGGVALTLASAATEQAASKPVLVVNRGVGGATTRNGLARFANDVEAVKPDHLIIYFGINDSANSAKLVPLDEFRRNLESMVDRARAVGTESIVLVTMNPIITEYWRLRHPDHSRKHDIDTHMTEYDRAIRKVAEANALPVADLRKLVEARGGATTAKRSLIRNEANSKSKDGVHLGEDGYRLMAELFQPIFKNRVRPGHVVVCLGDSLTYGAHVAGQGTSRGRTYPAWLWLLLNRMVGATNRDVPLDPPRCPDARLDQPVK